LEKHRPAQAASKHKGTALTSDFEAGFRPPKTWEGPAFWFIFQDTRMLVQSQESDWVVPQIRDLARLGIDSARSFYLGKYLGSPCFTLEIGQESQPPPGFAWKGLRGLLYKLDYKLFLLAGQARQVLNWDQNNRFCGACGQEMVERQHERAKECPACGVVRYPRLSPAIIVAVTRGREILLGHAPHFPPGMYSVLAGFVELGETLEETVAREVQEETGIKVKNIRYFGSQPWPFPDSLMIAFTAEYDSGEIRAQPQELEHADWFLPQNLPSVPNPGTISRLLIDDHLRRVGEKGKA
jgi:NAD+ diphosphatase